MTIEGFDVSHWQRQTPSLTGQAFAFVKASEGTSPDFMYPTHIARVARAGLVRGAYAFARDDVGLGVQANAFVAAAGKVDLFAIDVEGPHATSRAETAEIIRSVKAQVYPRKVGLYMSESVFFDAGQDFDWVAHYGVSAPRRHWDFHQFTSSPYDRNRFNGSLEALHLLAGIPVAPDTSTPLPPYQHRPEGATMWVETDHLARLFQTDGRHILRPVTTPDDFTFKAWCGPNVTRTWAPGPKSTKTDDAVFRQVLGQPHNGLWIRVNPADMGCTWHHDL